MSPGDVVRLPDGERGAIEKIVGRDAYVIQWHKRLGRGPWIVPLAQLELDQGAAARFAETWTVLRRRVSARAFDEAIAVMWAFVALNEGKGRSGAELRAEWLAEVGRV